MFGFLPSLPASRANASRPSSPQVVAPTAPARYLNTVLRDSIVAFPALVRLKHMVRADERKETGT
jgi:hypothetical protein